MTRLAFQLDHDDAPYRAAASRIGAVQVVGFHEDPDALVASQITSSQQPTLLVGPTPPARSPTHFPALPWRFNPHVRAVRDSLDAGQLGKPGLLRMHCWAPPKDAAAEFARIAAVDLALWLIGEQPDATHWIRSSRNDLLHLGFPSGAMAMLDFTESLPDGEGYRSLCLIGSNGAAYADDHRDRHLLFAGGPPGATPPDSSLAFLQPMMEDFVAAIRENRSPQDATRDLLNARQLVERALS